MGRCIRVAVLGVVALAAVAAAAPTVVINEIAWGGTRAGSQDEWIELRNCTASAVDLTGWVLVIGDSQVPLSEAAGSTAEVRATAIAPNDFLLLERTDDTTVSDVVADIIYRGSLPNTGGSLRLLDASGATIDEVVVGEEGWPAGSAGDGAIPYATMERVDPAEMGSAWRTNDGLVVCGLDASGAPLAGTPRAANSATVDYLKSPRVQLVSPSSGSWTCPVAVQWQAVDPDGAAAGLTIAIHVRAEGVETWTLVVENLANQGSFPWDCSLFPKETAYELRVTATDPERRVGSAISGPFTLR